MSYSFSVKGSSKAAVLAQLPGKFAEVLAAQPVHAADLDAAKAATDAFVGLIREPAETEDAYVSVSGSVWSTGDVLNSASVSVSAGLTAKTP